VVVLPDDPRVVRLLLCKSVKLIAGRTSTNAMSEVVRARGSDGVGRLEPSSC